MEAGARTGLRLYYPRWEYVFGLLGLGAVLIIVSQLAFRVAPVGQISEGVGIVTGVFGAVLVLVSGIIWLFSREEAEEARAIEAGEYDLHWRYDEADWRAYRARQVKPDAKLPLSIAGSLGFAAIIAGLDEDQGMMAMIIGAIGFALGGLCLGLGLRWMNTRSYKLMSTHPGECVIGPRGIYLTGTFSPWRLANRDVTGILLDDEHPAHLHVSYASPWGRPARPLIIPIPDDRIAQVRAWLNRFRLETRPRSTAFPIFLTSLVSFLGLMLALAFLWQPLSDYEGREYRACVTAAEAALRSDDANFDLEANFTCDAVLHNAGLSERQRFRTHQALGRSSPGRDKLDHYRNALAIYPDDSQTLREATASAIESGKYETAIDFATRLLAREPGDTSTRIALGEALFETGDFETALQALNTASKQDDGDAHLHFLLGQVYVELGRLGEAIAAYERSAALDPGVYEAQLQLGTLYLRVGRPEDAEPRFAAAAARNWPRREGFIVPKEERARLGVAVARCVRGRGDEVLPYLAPSGALTPVWHWQSSFKNWGYITAEEEWPGTDEAQAERLQQAARAWIEDGCPGPFDLPADETPDAGE